MKLLLIALSLFSITLFAAEVDTKKSSFTWHGTKVTGKHFGKIFIKTAKLDLKEGKVSSGEIVMDMKSFTVTDLEGEWANKFLGHMKSGDFFEVEKYPTAKLVIKSDDGKSLSGDLTIKSKTNPVKIAYTKKGKTYSGKLKFDRTKFDMIYGSGNFFKNLGDKVIHDEVVLDFAVVFK